MTASRVTIGDVARHAEVSTSAVSKVLRNAYGVSPAMRTRVLAAIKELGYRPHGAARALRGHTSTLGVLLPDLRNPFFPDLIDGIAEELGDTCYQVVISQAGRDPAGESRAVHALIDQSVGGVVLVAPLSPPADLEVIAKAVPVVVLGRDDRSPHYDAVFGDEEVGAGLVVEHLAGLGHRRIAHLADAAWHGSGRGEPATPPDPRAHAYERAMARLGLGAYADIVRTSYTEEGGRAGVGELLRRPEPPTAVFAGADLVAIGALGALREAGLDVPGDVSVAGYDNSWLAGLAHISLTSVDQPGLTMGRTAARLLLERIGGRTASARISITPTLVTRRTTAAAPPPGHNPDAANFNVTEI
ncbi:LacI family DNA-binding transcriptional regulator [Nonomuraea sp. MCN248]|uniref:LacI family DNA-binding transcriptional regulator n=1 Tax=Nonomuraea corallina TaxID=2989783 RepID=A0ABT4SJF4_9ACTN|nr:LacI family DNA-binding transcriptional regulator [Nonomuraea corallina]MDA0637351.1 LacI family DNA-binding transcriptional regulator [Nonomuraea corallina]